MPSYLRQSTGLRALMMRAPLKNQASTQINKIKSSKMDITEEIISELYIFDNNLN